MDVEFFGNFFDGDKYYANLDTNWREYFKHPNPSSFEFYQRQNFSLPSALIYYILKNPLSPKSLQKLQKTCKYFFAKNKIVLVDKWIYKGAMDLFCYGSYDQEFYFKDFKHMSFWFTQKLSVKGNIISKNIYRCSLWHLHLYDRQNLTLNELNFFIDGKKLEELWFDDVTIQDDNGNLVTCDQILTKVPNIKKFRYFCKNEIFTNKTFENMNAIKLFNFKFKTFYIGIDKLTADADITLLCNFIQENANEHSKFCFVIKMENQQNFIASLKLKKTVVEMLKTWKTKEKPIIKVM